ncbi:NAD-dependent epimerase/dehydratase family protein [Streptomyces arenae]|uniref:NAD-dependent epimerase/dehydratase family protein n=1 Tax=Streptomyces arenae TaxID=29301 RepID=UPI00265ABFBE|nr:NAD(P)-dependent oxidoreductase [Streptomyces arenae]MCG7205097.1 NAD(P)-dependent oxidoreductase [Streptomyces arenae]
MPTPTKVVVTGGSGRVGRYVVAELARTFDVINADRVASDAAVPHVETDVMDLEKVRAVTKGADAVIHLAAIDFDWKAAPEEYIRVNTLGSWNVLQAAAENGVKKVVLTSSISACGLSEMRPDWTPQYLAVDELHENRPTQAYSVSKQIIETMGLSVVRAGGPDVICLRPLAVVLPETFAEFTAFIDDPATRWLYYYVTAQDVARAFRAALETDGLRYGTFFLSAEDTCQPEPTLDWYRERIGELPEIRNPRLYRDNPRASIFSSNHARDLLGWEPTSDFLALRTEHGL